MELKVLIIKLSIVESIAKLNNKIKGRMNYMVNDEILTNSMSVSTNVDLEIFF